MKVLVVSHLFPSTANQVSGIFVKQQIAELVTQGSEVVVLSPVPWTPFPVYLLSNKWSVIHQIPAEDEFGGVKVIYPRYLALPRNLLFARSGKRMYDGIQSVVKRIHKSFQFDLIHAHVALPDGYAAMLLAEDYQKPFTVTIHGKDLQQSVNINHRCRKAISTVMKQSSKTIFVSNKLKRSAKKIFVNIAGYSVIPNGINPDLIRKQTDKGTSKKTNLIVLSVSNLVKTKGIDQNLLAIGKMINKFPNLRYQIIGDGPEMKFLTSLSHDLDLDQNVTFLGRLSHEQVLANMNECDIFSLPSWQEGFGIVYLEAMALGKPVIGCKGEGIEDFVVDGETGLLVEPKNPDQLVDAIEFLICNPEKARKMGEKAREFVLQNYTWEKNAEKMIDIYRNVSHGT